MYSMSELPVCQLIMIEAIYILMTCIHVKAYKTFHHVLIDNWEEMTLISSFADCNMS